MYYPTRTFRGPRLAPPFPPPAAPPARPREAPITAGQAVGLLLFALVNITLFIRPADLLPDLALFPSYEILIISCFVASLPFVYKQFSKEALRQNPISVCVLLMLVAVVLSHLFSPLHYFFIYGARWSAFKFAKLLVYYFLLIGLVDSPRRLRRFLIGLAVMITLLVIVTLLSFHGVITIPTPTTFYRVDIDEQTGAELVTIRLQSIGVFNDPNDMCLILVMGMAICLYLRGFPGSGLLGYLWLLPVGLFGYAVYLTKSRGGFLAMLMGLLVLFYSKYGTLRTFLLSLVVVPVMFVVFTGRQTELSSSEDTAQTRIQLWSEGIEFFKQAPLFGIGLDEFQEQQGLDFVPHNSYIHCYAELGFFGGTCFLGAFYFGLWGLHRLGSPRVVILDAEQRRLRPFVLAMLAGYATSLMTLSRINIQPTYMMLGLAMLYLRITPLYPPQPELRTSWPLARRLAKVSFLFLVLTYLYVRINVRWH